MGFFDIFRKPTKKELKKNQIRNNAEQGKSGEQKVVSKWQMNGWEMRRTGIGHDYIASKRNPRTGKMEYYYVEIKTGNAKLSPLQEEAKKKYGSRYVVERVQVNPFARFQDSNAFESRSPVRSIIHEKPKTPKPFVFGTSKTETTKKRTTQKHQKSILKSIFGSSNTKQKKTIKKPKSFSNAESLWGTTSTKTKRKKTRKKSSDNFSLLGGSSKSSKNKSNVDKIWGSSKSSRSKSRSKSRNKSNVDKIWGSSSKNTSIW